MRLHRPRHVRSTALAGLAMAGALALGTSLGSAGPAAGMPSDRPVATAPAARALTQPTTVNLPISTNGGAYTLASDGTFWTASGGENGFTVQHYDDVGNNLGDAGWSKSGGFGLVKSIAYYGGRVFLTIGDNIRSFEAHTGGTDRVSDSDTQYRLGFNQMIMRVTGNGVGLIALGQNNKVALMELTNNAPDHPFYGQSWWGGGITTGPPANGMESCGFPAVGPPASGEPDHSCGLKAGHADVFNYAIDMATTTVPSSVAVLSSGASTQVPHPRVGILSQENRNLAFSFGSFGSGNGEFDNPFSIVRNTVDDHYFISDQNNRRILEFSGGGSFIAGYGIGVGGGTGFETCGPTAQTCRAASGGPYYGRLDLLGGTLYAQRADTGTLEVFQLTPGGSGVGGGTVTTQPPPQAPVTDQVRLKAADVKVVKGKRTKLTATVTPSSVCATRSVLFQVKDGQGWDNLGGAKPLKSDCTVSRKSEKVTAKAQYRVLTINTTNTATMATSPVVTLKPKPRKK